MNWKGFKIFGLNTKSKVIENQPESYHGDPNYRGNLVPIRQGVFDGEKTPGELGAVYELEANSEALRLRAYEADLTNDIVKSITGKFFKWIIGSGMKLQAEPNEKALKTEGIHHKLDKFRSDVEARFDVFSNSTKSDYSDMENLHVKAQEAFKAAFFGDVLIVLRVTDGYPNVQVIDGEHVISPFLDDQNNWEEKAQKKGNIIRNGIELDKKGKHIAYYVHSNDAESLFGKIERIEVYGKRSKCKMAWMIKMSQHRIDSDRGIPVITPILEKVSKLDRYTEATVATAEERAKIVLAIEHELGSTGENPLVAQVKKTSGLNVSSNSESPFELAEKTATTIKATTSKQAINMPQGSKLSALYSQSEIQFEPFWKAIFVSLCAAVDIPPEVALQQYNSNYSASRAAINGWDYIVKIYRKAFSDKFYQPFYKLWLETEILKGKINAPKYFKNIDDFMITEAYSKARFTGKNMPHIDPVKEVKAVVEMIEKGLISHEQGAETLNVGEWRENYNKLVQELELKNKTTGNNDIDKTQDRE